ncbi:MAG: hypothetical protein WCG42_07060 [Parachlamydiaceae bacterium]
MKYLCQLVVIVLPSSVAFCNILEASSRVSHRGKSSENTPLGSKVDCLASVKVPAIE